MSREHCRSVWKESISMELKRRNEWNVGGGSGVRSSDRLVKIGKWSDGEQWVTDRDGANEEPEEVITTSRMWLMCTWLRYDTEHQSKMWSLQLERVHLGRQFETIAQLKQAVDKEWRALSQNFFNKRVNEWRRRLPFLIICWTSFIIWIDNLYCNAIRLHYISLCSSVLTY